jgi:ribosomal-protein-alanine N-acetyltransferase
MIKTFQYSLEGEESQRLIFRKLETADFNTWLEFCQHPDSLKYIWLTESTDPKVRCEKFFERVFNRYEKGLGGMNVLIDKNSQEFIGQCGLLIHTVDGVEELEIGYSLMPAARGKGYATEAARKCKEFAFNNHFRNSLISIIHIENASSAKVALNNGMILEKRTFYNNSDVNIYRIHKD